MSATKRLYRITDAGVEAFREWTSVITDYVPERDTAELRAAYFEWTDPDAIHAQLHAHVAHWSGMRDQWGEQVRSIGDGTHPIAEADQQIDWAERGLAPIDELEAPRG